MGFLREVGPTPRNQARNLHRTTPLIRPAPPRQRRQTRGGPRRIRGVDLAAAAAESAPPAAANVERLVARCRAQVAPYGVERRRPPYPRPGAGKALLGPPTGQARPQRTGLARCAAPRQLEGPVELDANAGRGRRSEGARSLVEPRQLEGPRVHETVGLCTDSAARPRPRLASHRARVS